jgi:uncharacterized protein (TIGR01777 family)
MHRIAITGSSGFVGQTLQTMFKTQGLEVTPIPRATLHDHEKLVNIMQMHDVIINLAGATILHRWSKSYKDLLYHSRIDTTKAVVQAMASATIKPKLFISTSAIGIYDTKQTHNETDHHYADDFLSNLCQKWENEAMRASSLGIRTVIFRLGVVLGKDGGALNKMLVPFKLGVGGTIGDGSQAFSFIHIDDLTKAFDFVIKQPSLKGHFNLTTPHPITNKLFTKAFGTVLHRPTVLPLPTFVLKLLFGEGATVLVDGQSVLPSRLLEAGFTFDYPTIEVTLENLLAKS